MTDDDTKICDCGKCICGDAALRRELLAVTDQRNSFRRVLMGLQAEWRIVFPMSPLWLAAIEDVLGRDFALMVDAQAAMSAKPRHVDHAHGVCDEATCPGCVKTEEGCPGHPSGALHEPFTPRPATCCEAECTEYVEGPGHSLCRMHLLQVRAEKEEPIRNMHYPPEEPPVPCRAAWRKRAVITVAEVLCERFECCDWREALPEMKSEMKKEAELVISRLDEEREKWLEFGERP